ncbi:Meiosis-specific protein HOP1 [Spathaspora sp. JA1]|nr:Meiosis-specific protein HOP1 [Spathaspora sp. JA1]
MQIQVYKQQVTKTQSHALVHEFLSVSLYCITFLRSIFEEENYIDTKYHSSDTKYSCYDNNFIKTKKLIKGVSTEADSLIDCIETGIKSALEKEYLKAVQFSIHLAEQDPCQAIESYVFGIDYENQSVSVQLNTQEKYYADTSEVMQQIQNLIKRLLVLTQSLDPLPQEKHISIRLMYNDNCPISYQPPFFKDGSCMNPLFVEVDKKNKIIEIGSVKTGKNDVCLNVFVKGTGSTVSIDPFDAFENGATTVEDIALPPSPPLSLDLGNYLDTIETTVEPTQLVPSTVPKFRQPVVGKDSQPVVNKASEKQEPTCIKCKLVFNPVAYGYNKPLKKRITCTKCVFNGEISWELSWLMNVRLLWNHLENNEITTFEELLDSLQDHNEKLIVAVFNRLFRDNILVITDSAILGSSGTQGYSSGSGGIIPSVTGIFANDNTKLIKGRQYFISFVPKLQKKYPYMSYDKVLNDIYFPNFTLNRPSSVKLNLERFLSLPKVNSDITMHQPTNTKTGVAFEKELSENLGDLSFEDSLVFLSQSQMDQPKRRLPDDQLLKFKKRKISIGRI